MRYSALILFVLAMTCEAFAYWGLSTAAGRHAFDEMAGMIPFAASLIGALLALGAVVSFWRRIRSNKRNTPDPHPHRR